MNEEGLQTIFSMIGAAGGARSSYLEAVAAAKRGDFSLAESMTKTGDELFSQAHDVHAKILADASETLMTEESNAGASLILVHAEDQMMGAESFRIIAAQLIDVMKIMDKNGLELAMAS